MKLKLIIAACYGQLFKLKGVNVKKSFKKYLSIYLSILIILLNCVPIVSHAAGEFTKQTGKGWIYSDETQLPTGENFYFQYASGKAWYTSNMNLALQLANRQGLVINPNDVNSVFGDLWDYLITNVDSGGYYKVYKGDVVVGIAVNDLSGCTLNNHTGTGGTFDVPSGLNNTIHNYLDDKTAVEVPDYISIPTITENIALNGLNANDSNYAFTLSNIENPSAKYLFSFQKRFSDSYSQGFSGSYYTNTVGIYPSRYSIKNFYFGEDCYLVGSISSLVSTLGLNAAKNSISYSDFITYTVSKTKFDIYDSSTKSLYVGLGKNEDGTITNDYGGNVGCCIGCSPTAGAMLPFSNFGWITIYNNNTVITDITNNVYAPKYRITKNFNEYDSTSNTNVTTINTNNIDNSQQNNETIYNNSNTEINQNVSENNYTYNTDNSSTIINNIVNNYYNDNSGDDGGGDDSGDGILDTLLDALLGFFRAIGKIITTILTGIVEILTDVLESITSISTDFGGITDFLSSFFSFVPEPIIDVLVLGVSLAVLISLIKMFRG